MILRKTSTNSADEYLLDNNNNNNSNNNNNNNTLIINTNNHTSNYTNNKESESNPIRFSENKSTKSNVLIHSNVKLLPPDSVSEHQQIINFNEAELAYEQHKRMTAKQKLSRSNQKGPSFLIEEDQQSYMANYDYEGEPKSSSSTHEIKSDKPFIGHSQKPFSSAFRSSNEKMQTFNRMTMMSMEENDNDEVDNNVDIIHKGQIIYHNSNYSRSDNLNSSFSQKYLHGISSPSNRQYNYDDTPQTIPQVMNSDVRVRKNPLLSTKSFSLDVPRFDQPNDCVITGSGGSSPGRYSEGIRKSSIAKHYHGSSSRMSPSPFSSRMNEPSFYTHITKNIPCEEMGSTDIPHSIQINIKDPCNIDSSYMNMDERSGRRMISPTANYPSRIRLTNTTRMLPKPIEGPFERNLYAVKRNFASNQRNEPNLRF
ncbi:unnamed protein product [Heterobilharzia americana]|nr:unnamed protein product [Heterobilharzia americana]